MEVNGMYFSLTFGSENTAVNTWDDWKMIPDTPPVIPPPEPNRRMVDIPGRITGPIDMSLYPFGRMTYQRITGSWTFLADPDYTSETRLGLYDEIRQRLHGVTDMVSLEEDPTHYFVGNFTVDPPRTGKGPLQIRISYDLEPVRYNREDDTYDITWVPGMFG